MSSPVDTPSSPSKASIIGRCRSVGTSSRNTSSTAARSIRSTTSPSRSSSRLSTSTFPEVAATRASRSEILGTASSSSERRALRTALAVMASWLVTLSRTDTPDRWLRCGLWRAWWLRTAMTRLMKLGTRTSRSATVGIVASWCTMCISTSGSSG